MVNGGQMTGGSVLCHGIAERRAIVPGPAVVSAARAPRCWPGTAPRWPSPTSARTRPLRPAELSERPAVHPRPALGRAPGRSGGDRGRRGVPLLRCRLVHDRAAMPVDGGYTAI